MQKCNPDGTAQVLCIRESACSGDCHKCSGCGAVKQTVTLTAKNPVGAIPGQTVILEVASAPVLTAAAMMYLLPLALFFAGYLLLMDAGYGIWGGAIGFVLGIAAVVLYDRRVMAKSRAEYTITEIVSGNENKGDNDLD